MKFYSGFSLENEQYLFTEYIDNSEYAVCGFSYGAINALNTTVEMLKSSKRVDKLQLFSPTFFQSRDVKFHRLQLMSYKKNKEKYMQQFLEGCFKPHALKDVETIDTDISELEELLGYKWSIETLKEIQNSGVKIEVYLGGQDNIIDVNAAKEFFLEVATVTYINNANHFLQIS